ncbi:DUF397 domain-containing protein [Streptomyces sp. NPDC006798]|uniref:DUF397 domain-containing protein n=1 Tax=Streptomyces sp. NPDC006798 TaxID=3155462 RepID=UPI0033CE5044
MRHHVLDVNALTWRKSSHSNPDGGQCLEVSDDLLTTAVVPVRDSKSPQGPVLMLPATGWSAFVTAVRTRDLTG